MILHELNKDAPVYHDLVAGFETFGDIVLVSGSITQGHVPARETGVWLGEIHERQILIVTQNCRNRDQQSAAFLAGLNLDADIHLFLQKVAGIVRHDTHDHRASVGIHQR